MRILLSICFFIFLFTPSFSQKNNLKIGVEFGPNLVFLRGSYSYYTYNPELTTKYFVGFNVEYLFSEKISIKSGILFENKGGLISYTAVEGINNKTLGKVTSNYTLEYFVLPILGKIKLGKQRRFYIASGITIGYLLQKRHKITSYDGSVGGPYYSTSNSKKIDWTFYAGFGWDIPINDKVSFNFELNNNLGLYNTSNVNYFGEGIVKTN